MSATTTTYKNFVGGEWVDAASGETMEVINPATGETVAEVPRCSAEDVDRAVAAANVALPAWLDSTPKERSELLHKLADVLEEHGEELAQLESLNVGKPLMASRDEMPFSADNLRFFAGAARNLEGKSASNRVCNGAGPMRLASNTTKSACQPSCIRPRPVSPYSRAGTSVRILTASSIESSGRSRTVRASRVVQ